MPISELLPLRVTVNREVLDKLPYRELMHVDTPEVYEDYVKKGLGPEREYHDLVQQNIAERGRGIRGWIPRRTSISVRRRPAGRAARTTRSRDHPDPG